MGRESGQKVLKRRVEEQKVMLQKLRTAYNTMSELASTYPPRPDVLDAYIHVINAAHAKANKETIGTLNGHFLKLLEGWFQQFIEFGENKCQTEKPNGPSSGSETTVTSDSSSPEEGPDTPSATAEASPVSGSQDPETPKPVKKRRTSTSTPA